MWWFITFTLIALILHVYLESKYMNYFNGSESKGNTMKALILVLMLASLSSVTTAAIYNYKTEDGSTILSNRPPSEKNKELTLVDVFHPDTSHLDWKTVCSKDKFNGSKSCTLSKMHSDVMVFIIDGRYSVHVGRNHFPRSQSIIKIDDHTPIYGYEGSSNTPQKAIEQMKRGKVAYTRYKEWPYTYDRDSEVDLTGFSEKYEQMLEEYKQL
ncbi:hypothetical protein [Acinetobacter johnsonii]|uniref:hypothetical protein n=1 Tax=Acinetobacter johnsonii TaxID=40214 RepID=UPI003019C21C